MSQFALGLGIFILIVLGSLSVGEMIRRHAILQELTYEIKSYNRSNHNNPSNGLFKAILAVHNQMNSEYYKPDCTKEKNVDDCSQVRMAEAAEISVWYTRYGFWLLVGTLIATIMAAVAARSAAKAAQDTFRQDWIISQKQVRAYLSCEGGHFVLNGQRLYCWINIRNHGQSPARAVKIHFPTTVLTEENATDFLKAQNKEVAFVPSGSHEVTSVFWYDDKIAKFFENGKRFKIQCVVKWSDVFSDHTDIKAAQTIGVMLESSKLTGELDDDGNKFGLLFRENLILVDNQEKT